MELEKLHIIQHNSYWSVFGKTVINLKSQCMCLDSGAKQNYNADHEKWTVRKERSTGELIVHRD